MRWLPWLVLLGCRPAVDAPEDVEEQAVFGFVHFDDPELVALVVDPLLDFVLDPVDELEDGFLVDQLTATDLGDVGVPEPSVEGVVGALGRAVYDLAVPGVAEVSSDEAREDWLDGTESFDLVDEVGDRACFLAGDCDTYSMTIEEVTTVPILGRSTRTFTNEHRWVTSETGRRALVVRQLAPEPIEMATAILRIDQQYAFSIVGPREDGAVRAEAIWVDAKVLGAELPEGYAVRQAVRRMQSTADAVDARGLGE